MKRYERYKPSGIEWIGEIPEHWGLKKFGLISYMKGRIGWQGLRQAEFTNEGPYLITGMNFENGRIDWDKVYHISEERYNEAPEIQIKTDDVLMTKDGTIGKLLYIDYLPGPASLNSHLLVFRPHENLYHPKYLFYQLQSLPFKHFIGLNKSGTTFFGITQDAISRYMTILPAYDEQMTIFRYLDRKTAQIDDLIAKKQKLIDLLNEEKTAIINQAVTKGLNPDAPVRGSGIPWLGEIPAHWEVKKLKYLGDIKYGLGTPPKPKIDGFPLIRATDIQKGEIIEDEMIFIDPEDVPYGRDPILKENDIIVVRSGAYTGDSAVIPQKYEGAVAGYDMVVRITKANAVFISYALLSHYVLKLQIYQHRLRAAQPHLNREELGETIVLLPNSGEQEEIVNFIRAKTFDIRDTISRIQREIELLQEYRTALISEVVTGKIDVRI